MEKLRKINFHSFCDVGCGDGRLINEVSELFRNKEIIGIDYSVRTVKLAKVLNPNLSFIKADIINDKIEKKFDVITLIEVFEHIPIDSTYDFVVGLNNLLKDNGLLILTVPHKNKPLNIKHFQHFTSERLRSYFNQYFTIEEEFFFERRNKLAILINLILTNRLFILNHQGLKNFLYKLYKKRCFYTNETKCERIFMKLRKK